MASLSYDYSLSNNTVADATHVMSNFNKVKTFVEASTVQVDGSVQAGTAAIANGAVTVDKLVSSVPRGVVAKSTRSTSTSSGSAVNCFDSALTFTPVPGRLYRVSFSGFIAQGLTDFMTIKSAGFVDTSNVVQQYLTKEALAPILGGSAVSMTTSLADSYLLAPSTTTPISINVRVWRESGADVLWFEGASNQQNYLLVEDLGLA
jgi:hypothetical protein